MKLFEKLDSFRPAYRKVKRWCQPLEDAAHILGAPSGTSSETTQVRMNWLKFELRAKFIRKEDQPMVENFERYTTGFWTGLFACYNTAYLPRTNNDQERCFRRTKTRHRRMTGLRSWNRYLWRNGEFVIWVEDALMQENVQHRLQQVPYETYFQERRQWESRLLEGTKRLRFRREPQQYLAQLEQRVCSLVGQA